MFHKEKKPRRPTAEDEMTRNLKFLLTISVMLILGVAVGAVGTFGYIIWLTVQPPL